MSSVFAGCFMLFGPLLFCSETEPARFLSTPSSRSFAVEGTDLTLNWTYTLDGGPIAVGFFSVTNTDNDRIGSRDGPGKINSTQKYEARFRAQAGNNRAELKILAVQLSDEATYKLTVVSGSGKFISSSAKVIVYSPPSNIITSSDLNVTTLAQLTLNCSADGKPKPTLTWTRVSDGTVVTMPLNITGGKDGGGYRCTADNGVGNPLTKVVKITIQSLPVVTLPQKVFVGREQNASLKCEVEGNPTPRISWSPCDEGNQPCDRQHLNIFKVLSARANYTCTATNALGTDSATTVLVIGGQNVSLELIVNEACDKKDFVWEKLKEELVKVFASTTIYSGAELVQVRCGSLIFDVVLKFSTEVAEDEILSIIQNAAADGKLGELSVKVSCYVTGIPPVEQTTPGTPVSSNSASNGAILKIGPIFYQFFFLFYICFI